MRQNFYKRCIFILVPETKDESLDACTGRQQAESLIMFLQTLDYDFYFVLQLQGKKIVLNNRHDPFQQVSPSLGFVLLVC